MILLKKLNTFMHLTTFCSCFFKNMLEKKGIIGTEIIMQYYKFSVKNNMTT